MRVLVFGAGPLGSLYAQLLHDAGADVSLLARGERHDWLTEHGVSTVNEITGERSTAAVPVVSRLEPDDPYDLAIVLVRKNKLPPIFETLAACRGVKDILFMGNNALGFDEYRQHLPAEKVLFGFPGAGGGIRDHVVHYADREKAKDGRRPVTIGEIDGQDSARIAAVRALFESAGVPVDVTPDIDGWLKYHVALVSPLCCALYKHDCDSKRAAQDPDTLRVLVRAAKEAGRAVRALGFRKRQPFAFNLFYWLPEFLVRIAVKGMLSSKFAEIAFSMHAKSARDEMREIADELRELATQASVETPNLDELRRFLD